MEMQVYIPAFTGHGPVKPVLQVMRDLGRRKTMSKSKKKHGSAFAVLVVIFMLLSVAFTVCSNVVFSGDRVPMIAGYYFYLHEKADMEPDIPANSLVLAREHETGEIEPGAKVLCYLADGNMAMRVIYNIETNEEDGTELYYPGTALEQGTDLTIGRSNIFAICTWASKELYTVIQFATSVTGLMALLVVPCIILIIMLLVKIARSSRDEDEDDEYELDEEEDDEPVRPSKRSTQAPLFDPDADLETSSYGRKKASIQENFSEKPVNENSPYQKAVQERTMKFKKIEQEDIERAMAATAAVRAANAAKEQQSAAPSYEGPVEATVYQAPPAPPQEPVSQQAKPYVPTHSADIPIVRSSEPEIAVSQAPNIDDIINPSQLRAAKAGQRYNPDISGTDSINDLIAALEKEKNKL